MPPKRGIGGLGELEDLPARDALRKEAELFRPRKLRGVLPLHETRERFSHEGCALRTGEFLRGEAAHIIIEAMRDRERRAALAADLTTPGAEVIEKLGDAGRGRRLGESPSRAEPAMV